MIEISQETKEAIAAAKAEKRARYEKRQEKRIKEYALKKKKFDPETKKKIKAKVRPTRQRMEDLKYYDVIIKPMMTEKTMTMVESGKYSFFVHPKATKPQIKNAVQSMFEGVKVASVNTMITAPKKRHRRGFAPGKTTIKKKAIVTLKPGSKEIELFPGL